MRAQGWSEECAGDGWRRACAYHFGLKPMYRSPWNPSFLCQVWHDTLWIGSTRVVTPSTSTVPPTPVLIVFSFSWQCYSRQSTTLYQSIRTAALFSYLSRVLFPMSELPPWPHVFLLATAVITMASSMIIRSLFVLVVLAMAAQTNAQCNTTLLQAVHATPELSLLYTVIAASGLAMTIIDMTDNVTVLAPNNNAFNGTNGLLALLKSNDLTLENVTTPGANRAASMLLYHILPAPYFAANLGNGLMSPTLLGDYELTISTIRNITFIAAANNATVLVADIPVCNSVVHIVDRVLLPASNLTAIPVANTTAAPPGSPPTVTLPPSASPSGSDASTISTGSLFLGMTSAVAAALMV